MGIPTPGPKVNVFKNCPKANRDLEPRRLLPCLQRELRELSGENSDSSDIFFFSGVAVCVGDAGGGCVMCVSALVCGVDVFFYYLLCFFIFF